jgi:tetratricopeptide (TPR) repeat protein
MPDCLSRGPISPLVELWIGLEQPKLGDAISLVRQHFGLTRTSLIQQMWDLSGERDLGVDESLVYRWERGEKGKARSRPGPRYRMLLGRVCEREVESLSESSRREFLGKLAAVGGPSMLLGVTGTEFLIGSAHWSASPQALGRAAAILSGNAAGGITAAEVGHITGCYAALRNRIPGTQLIGAVRAHVELIAQHLRESSMATSLRAELVSALGEASVLAGVLSCWDIRDESGARHHFETAGAAAREAGDRVPGIFALGFTAELEMYQQPARAIELNQVAQEMAAHLSSPRVRSWLATNQARASAYAGARHDEVLRPLDRAREEMAQVKPDSGDSRLIQFFNPASLARYEGETLMRAGQAGLAIQSLRQAAANTEPSLKSYHAEIAAEMASALAQQGEVEESCKQLGRAFDLATSVNYRYGMGRVLQVRRDLEQWNDTQVVKQLDERLRIGWAV